MQSAVSAVIDQDRTWRGTWTPAQGLKDQIYISVALEPHPEGIM